MAGKSIAKYVVTAIGTIDGKKQMWIVGVFPGLAQAKPWVGLLNVARKAGDEVTVKAMDVHQPATKDGAPATDVKYTGAVIQYAPEITGLDDDTTLG